jgi:hypothetical protein
MIERSRSRGFDKLRLLKTLLIVTGLLGMVAATPAFASESIESFTTTSSDPAAGDHPDLSTSFSLVSPGEPEAARNVIFNAPEGLFGNPNAVTPCSASDFALDQCPSNAQAGLITIYANYEGDSNFLLGTAPIFHLEPEPSQTALFALVVPTLNIPIDIPVAVRTAGDYGLRFTVSNITQLTPLAGANLTFWGLPALESHDAERFAKGAPGEPSNCVALPDTRCIGTPTPASIPVRPFTDNPTTCTGEELVTSLTVQTYQDPEHPTTVEGSYPATTSCDLEVFNPVLYASPTTNETDSPSGLDIELSAPQFLGLAASPSELKAATVTLPEGLTINPDAADGQFACADAQANFDSEGSAECPDRSKIGTFQIGTQALDGPLEGAIYIGEPKPGNQYRLFLIASGFGINAKLVGSFHPDPQTGQVSATFEDLPQVPFESFDLHLFASDRGLMATPTRCTIYTTEAVFYPWNSTLAEQESTQIFSLDSGPHGTECPGRTRPFDPRLQAGTSNATAGSFSAFTLKLDREDGDQFLGKLNFTMPPGLTADLRGVTYCPEADIFAATQTPGRTEQNDPSCPQTSEIGTSNVAAGPGSHPFHAVGKIYLAGPFRGAPLSLVAVTPALAGPYDYGTVVVRVALHIDQLDAHVIADSETVPAIIGGIPIRMRSIQVNIDKPNFMINPTNCSSFAIASEGIGNQGTVADFRSPFSAVNCAALGFAPKMMVRQVGRESGTQRGQNPQLDFDLITRPGDSNIQSLAVTLPNAFEIDQSHLSNICTEKELAATRCAGRQAIGEATTRTPLLEQPLSGPVYAVSGSGGLPRLAFILDGQVSLLPRAETKTVKGKLQTTVPVVPDAPIGHFHLMVFGGKHGYLANTRDLCKHAPVVNVAYSAQSRKSLVQRAKIRTSCGKPRKLKQHKRRKVSRSSRTP